MYLFLQFMVFPMWHCLQERSLWAGSYSLDWRIRWKAPHREERINDFAPSALTHFVLILALCQTSQCYCRSLNSVGRGAWGLSSYISRSLPFLLLFYFVETWYHPELRLASGFVWGNLELLIPLLYLSSARIADVCHHMHFTSFMCLQGLNQEPIICLPTTLLTELHPQSFFLDG